MTRDKLKFVFYTKKKGDYIIFGGHANVRIICQGNVSKNIFSLIENVLFVNSLKHNFLSINQLCDKSLKVIFELSHCIIKNIQNEKIIFMGHKSENVYTIDIQNMMVKDKCFSTIHDQS